jgi:arylsulfatase A-like enzyme
MWFASHDPHRPYDRGEVAPSVNHERDVIVPAALPVTPVVRGDLARYYDEISRLDGYVGQVRQALEEQGLSENTYVILLSDNGRPFPGAKTMLTDNGIRTPLIFTAPGSIEAGQVASAMVSSIDLGPTILELAGLPPLPGVAGRSFAGLLHNPHLSHRDVIFAEQNWHDFESYERGIRTPDMLYIRNWVSHLPASPPADGVASVSFQEMRRLQGEGLLPAHMAQAFASSSPEEYLFDLRFDPDCLHNLAADAAYQEAKASLAERLAAWREMYGDVKPEHLTPDFFDRMEGTVLPTRTEERRRRYQHGE